MNANPNLPETILSPDNPNILLCPICNQPWLEKLIDATPDADGQPVIRKLLRHDCACEQDKQRIYSDLQRHIDHHMYLAFNRTHGFLSPNYQRHTFAIDNNNNPEVTQKCLKYVNNWDIALENNFGIFIHGDSSTGKTFFACCIANAILDKGKPYYTGVINGSSVYVATFTDLINRLASLELSRKEQFYQNLSKADLLVIDDFGSERQTEYLMEQMNLILDVRERARKPLIVTSNLAPVELVKTNNRAYKRICERILGMCGGSTIHVKGNSQRLAHAAQQRATAKELIGI